MALSDKIGLHGAKVETITFWSLCFLFASWMVLRYQHDWYLLIDDWTILGSRMEHLELYGFDDFLLRRHNEHLMGGMVLWNVGLAEMFGLRSYLPWIVSLQLANVFVAWTLKEFARRIGVSPITAAVAAPLFLIWGPFSSVAAWAPEAIFPISLALVFAQYGLSSHDDPRFHRTIAGACIGTLGVFLHSACVVAIPLIVLWLAMKRRWIKGIIASIPVALYGLWFVTYQTRPPSNRWFDANAVEAPNEHSLLLIAEFSAKIVSRIAANGSSVGGFALIAVLIFWGAKVAFRSGGLTREMMILALTTGAIYLFAFSWTRGYVTDVIFGMEPPARYAAVVAVPIAPVALLGGQAILQRVVRTLSMRQSSVRTAVLLLLPVLFAAQVAQRVEYDKGSIPFAKISRARILELADDPLLSTLNQDQLVFGDNWLNDIVIGDISRFRRLSWL